MLNFLHMYIVTMSNVNVISGISECYSDCNIIPPSLDYPQ